MNRASVTVMVGLQLDPDTAGGFGERLGADRHTGSPQPFLCKSL